MVKLLTVYETVRNTARKEQKSEMLRDGGLSQNSVGI
jgi:hypothetical protein